MSIAEEYQEALIEAGTDVSGAALYLVFSSQNKNFEPWEDEKPSANNTYSVVAMEIQSEELVPDEETEKEPILMRVFTLSAVEGYRPKYGDSLTYVETFPPSEGNIGVESRNLRVKNVRPFSPFGSAIAWKVGVTD